MTMSKKSRKRKIKYLCHQEFIIGFPLSQLKISILINRKIIYKKLNKLMKNIIFGHHPNTDDGNQNEIDTSFLL